MRAQHPGSAKIEEFLGQLEVLWEELKKQHQRNVVVLQASEELNFRVSNQPPHITSTHNLLPR